MSKDFIPLSVPNLCGNELEYVTKAMKTEWVSTGGGYITQLEQKFAAYLDVEDACACQSGTAGLHLCLRHFGIGSGDIVLVPTLTFIATINAVMYQNATPVFFDCDKNMCMDPQQVRCFLENECTFEAGIVREKCSGASVKAMIPVNVFGDLCDIKEFMEIAQEYNLIVIEDATESLGSVYDKEPYAGRQSGTVGHAGVYSFNGNKLITTGGGGMIVSNDAEVVEHMRYLSQQAKNDVLYFVHDDYGYNYRMTNVQAAIGIGQFEQLDRFLEIKKENYNRYCAKLADLPYAKIYPFTGGQIVNYWFYSLKLNQENAKLRDKLITYMGENNIQLRPIWKLNHTQKPFVNYRAMSTANAWMFYNSIVNIPCSTNLTEEQIDKVCEALFNLEW